MTQAHENSIIRLLSAIGTPAGTGFLLSETSALTCAHVVAAALGQSMTNQTPSTEIRLDFPLLAAGEMFSARVTLWDSEKDSAVLEISGALPSGAQPARLVQSADLWQHPFRAFGFPAGLPNGVWASGRILGREAAGWYQVEDTKETGYFVQPGFSGGAVWDDALGGVVGMVIASDIREDVRAAFSLPLVKALGEWLAQGLVQVEVSEVNTPAEPLHIYYPMQTVVAAKVSPGRKRIFLSYKRGAQPDEALALALYESLSREHVVFIDQVMPVGTEWRERIQRELENCDFLVPLLSPSSAHSEMVEYEVSIAHQLGRARAGKPAILPVRVAYSAPFEYPLSAYLNPLNWAFWRSEADTPALIAELRIATTGGELSLSDLRQKQALLSSGEIRSLSRPTASADLGQLERPDGTMEAESRFYLKRPCDEACQREVNRGGATVVIKAPRQMGKSSLLVRAADQARKLGREVVFLDFQLLDEAMLGDPQRFFQGFCRWIADELDIDDSVDEVWRGGLGHVQSCTKYIRRHALKGLEKPITLALDEVDRLLGCPFRSDFFGMLRSWHNNRATGPEWRKLDLFLVISTEPYLLIDDLKQSPFNVGEVIRLEDFSMVQTAELNDRHGSPFDPSRIQRLFNLLGGHPYLTRQALYRVALGETSAENLLANAANENGPFGDHLRRHLTRFSERPELAVAMLQVIRHQACSDDILYNRLHGAGLATRMGECVVPRCELYAQYFGERLSHE
jgi:hypothetical protein